ncbi:hypothetical protein ABZ484_13310 [Streptomyces sp. NPDC006393]|uniref:hypothetical protein n=1 Tax=Streptomyces sp. NPDC006393 TaxID=3156763 RepID=UPI0034005D8C
MATKTADEAGATEAGEATETAEATEPLDDEARAEGPDAAESTNAAESADAAETMHDAEAAATEAGAEGMKEAAPSGVGQGAGAVVSAALGLVSLSGSWLGTVAGAREQLIGQLRTSTSASVAQQIKEVYGDAWHTTALWGGLFALLALIVGVVVLARPAFGAPAGPQAPWIKSVSWAGVTLGVLGLLLAVLKYTDALLALPSA